VLVIVTSSIQQFTVFGGLPNSAALLEQITRTWRQLATDGFAQLLAIMLPVLLALLTPLYIAFSIQGSRSPDRDDHVTNEQVALQQMREGVVLILAGLTGVAITLAIPWLTERAPLLLLQGSEDAIVPADQATAMHRAVADRGLPVALKVFPGEGHGFRIDSNIRRALEAELSFYAQVWGLDSPEEYRDAIRVENLD